MFGAHDVQLAPNLLTARFQSCITSV